MTGHLVLQGTAPLRYATAAGVWSGTAMRDDAVALARMSCQDLSLGMSGAPVLRVSDGAVVAVVSARYNPPDSWSRDTVWLARTEDLVTLLAGSAPIVLVDQVTLTEPVDLTLTVDAVTVHLFGGGIDVRAAHQGIGFALAGALDDVRRARARAGSATRAATIPELRDATTSMRQVGELMAASFLPTRVRDELAEVIRRAEAASQAVRIGIRIAPDAARYGLLPWEALPEPVSGQPLALHRLTTIYRKTATAAPRQVPGPLRIVVAISSPTGGGAVLDYERELRGVLAAVKGARAGQAQVRIVPFATTTAIRAALDDDVHVLHISAHGAPGVLILEDEDGAPREVTAETFLAEAVPPGRMPPVICLAACYTNVAADTTPTPAEAGDPEGTEGTRVEQQAAVSFAADLAAHGAAAVIGTETSVTDRYATRVFAQVYRELAHAAVPDLVAALAQARRVVQDQLASSADPRDQAVSGVDERGVVSVLAGAGALRVFDAAAAVAPFTLGAAEPAGREVAGLLARDPGDFVGRRPEQRRIPRSLLAGDQAAGIVLTGIGGIGKTTLAAEIVRRCWELDPNLVVATVTGSTDADAVLHEIGAAIRARLALAGGQAAAAGVELANLLNRVDVAWQDRARVLTEQVLGALPVLIVWDNFEDNLPPVTAVTADTAGSSPQGVTDENLAGLLAALVCASGRGRVLVTCRYPFKLPGGVQDRLRWQALGPLTFAETMKLVWALPQLDDLPDEDLERVWRAVGGHPRTLEYLDAVLAGGQGRLGDITRRLHDAATDRLGAEAATDWFTTDRDLDAALADVVTLAADDVLLPALWAGLSGDARRLLIGLSVFREPVDAATAALFAVGDLDESAAWTPDRQAAQERILATLTTYGLDVEALNRALTQGTLTHLPSAAVAALQPDLDELVASPLPPRSTTLNMPDLIDELAGSSLLSLDLEAGSVFVHRWTATETHRILGPDSADDIRRAHLQAAAYWRWRVSVWPQDQRADVHDLLEARQNLHAGGDDDAADQVTQGVCNQLDTWGALDHEHSLIVETLAWLGSDHPSKSAYIHQVGMLAQARGDYETAETSYRQALTINERLGNQAGMASSYHQLGMLAQDRGDYETAETSYRQSLTINERLGNQAGMATSYHQLGILAQDRGDYETAETSYRQSLTIDERLGNQAGMASSYHQLGMLAQDRGDYETAETSYRQSLTINERLGNQAGMATSYHQLGILARNRGEYETAETSYRQSLTIFERLGNQVGMASSYHQLGILAQDRGDYETAETSYRQSLTIFERLGNQVGMASSYHQLGMLAQDRGDYETAETSYRQSLTIDERLGNQAGMATSYGQLGILAYLRGDYETAETSYRQALTIDERLGNQAGMATSYGQLGILAQARGDYETAETSYRQSLTINERLGNQAGMATSYHQLGILAQARGDYETAETSYRQSLTINERLGNQAGMASSYHQLGILAQARGDYETAETSYRQSLTINERLGNQAGMAMSWSQFGILRTVQGRHAESVPLHVRALAVRLGIGIPQARIDARALVELLTVMGPKVFASEVAAVLDAESAENLMSLLDRLTDDSE
ncbi:MAG: tetratricopeptide repeat protein [Kineosporiaceae bacterium]|nr:tetratricopeptide repeat protein [Kineosporiaceae bacterium]